MSKLPVCVFLVFISAAVNGQRPFYLGAGQKPTCVNEGDYCRANSDCCSQTCTNSTSQCAAAISASTNDVTLTDRTNTTLDNRFNEAEAAQNCLGISESCKAGRDCCSKTCSQSLCVGQDNREGVQCSGVDQKCSSTARGCCEFLTCEKGVCRDRAVLVEGTETLGYQEPEGLDNRFDEVGNQTTAQPVVPTRCMEVGEKCYRHEECCSPLKCHSFLHQCVT